jgi:hypothetical protein
MARNKKWELGVKGRVKTSNISVGVGASFGARSATKPKKKLTDEELKKHINLLREGPLRR